MKITASVEIAIVINTSKNKYGMSALPVVDSPCIYCSSSPMTIVKNDTPKVVGDVKLKCLKCGACSHAGFGPKIISDYKLLVRMIENLKPINDLVSRPKLSFHEKSIRNISKEFITKNGVSPTMKELEKISGLNFRSCHRRIKALENKGYLIRHGMRNKIWEFKDI